MHTQNHQALPRHDLQVLDDQPIQVNSCGISPQLQNYGMPSPIQCNNSVKEADFASNEVTNNLNFLQRDLAKQEIQACEISAHRYINNDSFEIEIHNLNEINEYFRILKDIILKNQRIHK
jgi:hypothetical protein